MKTPGISGRGATPLQSSLSVTNTLLATVSTSVDAQTFAGMLNEVDGEHCFVLRKQGYWKVGVFHHPDRDLNEGA